MPRDEEELAIFSDRVHRHWDHGCQTLEESDNRTRLGGVLCTDSLGKFLIVLVKLVDA